MVNDARYEASKKTNITFDTAERNKWTTNTMTFWRQISETFLTCGLALFSTTVLDLASFHVPVLFKAVLVVGILATGFFAYENPEYDVNTNGYTFPILAIIQFVSLSLITLCSLKMIYYDAHASYMKGANESFVYASWSLLPAAILLAFRERYKYFVTSKYADNIRDVLTSVAMVLLFCGHKHAMNGVMQSHSWGRRW